MCNINSNRIYIYNVEVIRFYFFPCGSRRELVILYDANNSASSLHSTLCSLELKKGGEEEICTRLAPI